MPKLTIVTLTYNAEAYLEHMLQSVAAQTCRDFEFVILDGVSTDRTLDIAAKYSSTITKLISRPDKGALDALNKAWAELTGDFVMLLGGDDWLEPDCVEAIVETARKNPKAEVIKFGMSIWQQHGKNVTFVGSLPEPDDGVFDIPAAVYGGCINHALSRDLCSRVGLYAHDKWGCYADRDLHVRIALSKPAPVKAVIANSLFNFRNHDGSSTANWRTDNIAASMMQSRAMALAYLERQDLSSQQRRQLEDWYAFCWVRSGYFLLKSGRIVDAGKLLAEGMTSYPAACLRRVISPAMPAGYKLKSAGKAY